MKLWIGDWMKYSLIDGIVSGLVTEPGSRDRMAGG